MFELLCTAAIENRLHNEKLKNLGLLAKCCEIWDLNTVEKIDAATTLLKYGQPNKIRIELILSFQTKNLVEQFLVEAHVYYENELHLDFQYYSEVWPPIDKLVQLIDDSK